VTRITSHVWLPARSFTCSVPQQSAPAQHFLSYAQFVSRCPWRATNTYRSTGRHFLILFISVSYRSASCRLRPNASDQRRMSVACQSICLWYAKSRNSPPQKQPHYNEQVIKLDLFHGRVNNLSFALFWKTPLMPIWHIFFPFYNNQIKTWRRITM